MVKKVMFVVKKRWTEMVIPTLVLDEEPPAPAAPVAPKEAKRKGK